MYTIKQLPEFSQWLSGLKDTTTRRRLARRLRRAMDGNFGDAKPVGSGVFEMREFFGSGFRMYYTIRKNIARAIGLLATLPEEKED
jgi:putative addiction module killer protein